MSDAPQGPGWWQASDGKWYAPEQAPGAAPAPGYGVPAGDVVGTTLADWGQRVVAYLIDGALLFVFFIVGLILSVILGQISSALGGLVMVLVYLVYIAGFFYYGYLVGLRGSSPGMALTGLKCVGEETGQVIGGGTGVVRSLATIVNGLICSLGWLWPLWDAKNQTWSDKIMKTVVYSGQPKQSFSLDLFKP